MCVLCIYCLHSTPFCGGKPDHNNARGFCIPRKSQKPVATVMMTLSCETGQQIIEQKQLLVN